MGGNCCITSKNQAQSDLEELQRTKANTTISIQSDETRHSNQSSLSTTDLKDQYKIQQIIGKGAFAVVYLAKDKQTNQEFAVKVLKKDKVMKFNQLANTKSERAILEKLNNPFIVKLHNSFETQDKLFFVLDYLPGGELFDHIRREQRFTERKAQFYGAELLLAIECLHQNNIIYRDLKPENVLIDADGHLKLTDFGLSKIKQNENEVAYTFCGTPEYLAPEVVVGQGHGKYVDYWSFGLIVYEMISGINPFKVKNKNKFEKLQMITQAKIPYFPIFSENAKSLLQALLVQDPRQRLGFGKNGIQNIKNHKFFEGIVWEDIYHKRDPVPDFQPLNAEQGAIEIGDQADLFV